MEWASLIAILIVALTLLLMYKVLRGGIKEAFLGTGFDVAAYLAALEEYNGFFKAQGYRTCKVAATADRFCGAYGGRIGGGYTYSPPLFEGARGFAERIAAFNASYGATESPVSIGELPGPAVEDWAPLEVARDAPYVAGILFTFYCARPAAGNFTLPATATGLEKLLAGATTLSVRGTDTLSPTYTAVLRVGGEVYKFRKVFVDDRVNNPQGYVDVLGLRREFEQGPELCVAGRDTAAARAFRNVAGSAWETTGDAVLTAMLTARSQEDLNARLAAGPVAAAGAGAGIAGGAAGAPAVQRQVAGQIQIPAVTYFEDAWMRNKALFERMYKSVPAAAAVRTYYQSVRFAQGDSYEKTVLRFVELDKRILAAATVNGRVQPEKLRIGDGGSPYKFEVPFPYDPQLQIFGADVEEPSLPAIDLKCFKVSPGLQRIKAYFAQRPYEDLRTSNTEVFGKIRANLCASYGYVSRDTLERCGCEGCCIPIAYVQQTGKSTKATPVDDTGAELLAAAAAGDNCIRFNGIMPFRAVRGALGSCEGWEDAGAAAAAAAISTAAGPLQSAEYWMGAMRGWKMFDARAPLVMGFTGSGAPGCPLPPGTIKRAPMKIVKYNPTSC